MELFAKMGGAPLTDEAVLFLCGLCAVWPLVVLLAGRGVFRHSLLSACVALLLSALPLLLLLVAVARYEPSDDWEVESDQAVGWRAVGLYAVLTVVAGLSLLCAAVKWPPQGRDDNSKSDEPVRNPRVAEPQE